MGNCAGQRNNKDQPQVVDQEKENKHPLQNTPIGNKQIVEPLKLGQSNHKNQAVLKQSDAKEHRLDPINFDIKRESGLIEKNSNIKQDSIKKDVNELIKKSKEGLITLKDSRQVNELSVENVDINQQEQVHDEQGGNFKNGLIRINLGVGVY